MLHAADLIATGAAMGTVSATHAELFLHVRPKDRTVPTLNASGVVSTAII
jgi:hypothetical protein